MKVIVYVWLVGGAVDAVSLVVADPCPPSLGRILQWVWVCSVNCYCVSILAALLLFSIAVWSGLRSSA